MFVRDEHFIAGEWVPATGPDVLDVVSPSTEQVVGRVPVATAHEADLAVAAARAAFDSGPWPRMGIAERAAHLRRFIDALDTRREQVLSLQIDEMGATHKFAVENYNGIRPTLESFIRDAEQLWFREVRQGLVGKVLVVREPIGVVVGITPWNSPVMIELQKILPSLLMGCPIIVKPAPECPLSAYMLGEAAIDAGLPTGVLSILNGGVDLGSYLVSHPRIDHVTFTGSPNGGRAIAAACAEKLRAVTLELGGKSAAIVLPGTDMTPYYAPLVAGSLRNCGQICVSTNRVLVQENDRDRVVAGLVAHLSTLKQGDPHDPETDFGPLAAARQRFSVERFIESGKAAGATIALGGGRPADQPTGWFVEPTVFVGVDNKMEIAQEEIFGPVLSVITYTDEDDAIAIANDSKYGLGGAVYADNVEDAIRVASRIETGTVQINGAPAAGGGGPFAGRKDSGLGVERSYEGLASFLELKSMTLPAGYEPA